MVSFPEARRSRSAKDSGWALNGEPSGSCGVCGGHRGRSGEARTHQLLLLCGADHDGAALGISGEELARHDAAAAALAEGLEVHALKLVLLLVELEHADSALPPVTPLPSPPKLKSGPAGQSLPLRNIHKDLVSD